jgi:alkylated DNA repair dioxygenase AlkB
MQYTTRSGRLFSLPIATPDVPHIPGLIYRPNYVSPGAESELIAAIDAALWDTTWERRRQLYGGVYGKTRDAPRPLPAWGLQLAVRLSSEGLTQAPFDQMLVNEYLSGQGIALHGDYQSYGRTVASLSLLSPCVMDFRHPDGRSVPLLFEPRSLLLLTDVARYEWQHGIARRKSDRWEGELIPRQRRLSVTFRHSVE